MSVSERAIAASGGIERERRRNFSDPEIERALDWLRDSAKAMGEARQRMTSAEHMVRHVEALMFKASSATSAEARKADARSSERYLEAVHEDAVAAGEYEKMRALREAASLKIAAWQSECANQRATRI